MAIMRTLSANSFSYCDNCEHQNGARSGTHPHCHRGGLSIVPVWVMQDKGLLTRRGVTAEIVQNPSSPVAIQAMLLGEVEAIVTSAATLGLRACRKRGYYDHVNDAHHPVVLMAVENITDVNSAHG